MMCPSKFLPMMQSQTPYNGNRNQESDRKASDMSNHRHRRSNGALAPILCIVVALVLAISNGAFDGTSVGDAINSARDTITATKAANASDNANGNASNSTNGNANSTDASGKSGTYQWTAWDEQKYPDCYRIVGDAVVDHDVKAGTIEYDGFDSLGRTQRAVGNITKQMIDESAGWRAGFKSDVDSISGWKGNNHKISVTLPNGKSYSGYCYNRSHLVGDCLGGYDHVYASDGSINPAKSKSEKRNLVTGTRMQNVGQDGKGGMAYCENLVCEYLESHPNVTVYYSATPVYDGNDLVCRSVFVDMKSSDGGINQEVEVFNAESGCTIDYATGELTQS